MKDIRDLEGVETCRCGNSIMFLSTLIKVVCSNGKAAVFYVFFLPFDDGVATGYDQLFLVEEKTLFVNHPTSRF